MRYIAKLNGESRKAGRRGERRREGARWNPQCCLSRWTRMKEQQLRKRVFEAESRLVNWFVLLCCWQRLLLQRLINYAQRTRGKIPG